MTTMKRVLVVLALAVCVSTRAAAFTPGASVATNVASGLSGGAKRAPFASK
jgi:threonine/homoserine/homoserine lactone efflux protein